MSGSDFRSLFSEKPRKIWQPGLGPSGGSWRVSAGSLADDAADDGRFGAFQQAWKRGASNAELFGDDPFQLGGALGAGNSANRRPDVAKVETFLGQTGHYKPLKGEGPGGYVNTRLDEAIRAFQSDNGLDADGIVTPQGMVLALLQRMIAARQPPRTGSTVKVSTERGSACGSSEGGEEASPGDGKPVQWGRGSLFHPAVGSTRGDASGMVHVRAYEQTRDGEEVQVSDYVRRRPGTASGTAYAAPLTPAVEGLGVGGGLASLLGAVPELFGSLLDFALDGASEAAGSLVELAQGGNVMTDAATSFLGPDALPPNLQNVDMSFIQTREGAELKGYFPDGGPALFPKSGATVGVGIDLGQMNAADLADLVRNHGLNPDLAQKLSPYLGKKGVEAADYLQTHGFTLSKEEARNLTVAKLSSLYGRLEANFDQAQAAVGSKVRFADLPKEARTVACSVATQYGPDLYRPEVAPRFWDTLISRDWGAMDTELRHFGDNYGRRRIREADYLKPLLPSR